jgi:hypothetical protein
MWSLGGIAAILHGVPRATFDLDILIEATPENAQNLLNALADARLGTAGLTTPQEVLANEITVFCISHEKVKQCRLHKPDALGEFIGRQARAGQSLMRTVVVLGQKQVQKFQ